MAGTRNKLPDLRDHLFETLEALKDPDKPMDVARAQAICKVAGTIIASAKVEVAFMVASGEEIPGEFFGRPALRPQPQLSAGKNGSQSRRVV